MFKVRSCYGNPRREDDDNLTNNNKNLVDEMAEYGKKVNGKKQKNKNKQRKDIRIEIS